MNAAWPFQLCSPWPGSCETGKNRCSRRRKLAAIGILIAGVSHEIGNPLNNISMLAQNFVELYDRMDRDEHIEYVKKIEERNRTHPANREGSARFCRPKKPDFEETDINNVVNKSMRLVQNMISICNLDSQLDLGRSCRRST